MKKIRFTFDANPLVNNKSGVGHFTERFIMSLEDQFSESANFTGYYIAPKSLDLSIIYKGRSNVTFIRSPRIISKLFGILRRLNIQPPLELITRSGSDIVIFTNFVSLPLFTRSKTVLTVYDLCFIDCPEYVAEKNKNYLRKWVSKSISKANHVLTISEFTKGRIIEVYGVPENKIHVMPIPPKTHPVNTKHTRPERFAKLKDYLLFVGTIEPRKNIMGLLKAYELMKPELRQKHPLILAGGKGWLDDEILEKIAQLNSDGLNIIQTGYITDEELSHLYSQALICVQPSHYEGFGMPILEAMSYGKPVACSDIEVFHEVGRNAPIFFNQANPEDMAEKISSVITNKQILKLMAQRSRELAKDYPNWGEVTLEFWHKVVDQKS